MSEETGDFEEVESDSGSKPATAQNMPSTRARFPKNTEQIGTIVQRLGGNRMLITLVSGKQMNCRVPGRFKRTLWLRERDVVLVEPWEFDPEKGDVIYKYSSSEIAQLKKRGLLHEHKQGF
jgi:translation initiation factor 1A